MLYPMKFIPVYKDYMWGGRNFEKFGRPVPDGKLAESWEVSCHKNGVSIVANGYLKGMTLPEAIASDPRGMLGTRFETEGNDLPLLIKFIDANDKLSIQVHPDDSYAAVYEGGAGKNEMWYILDAKPGAKLIAGLKPGTTIEEFKLAAKSHDIERYLNEIEVVPGDVISIPAGLVHSIGEGIVLIEIQQTSDITYRIYDYNRVDSSGNKRPLHLERALEVIDFSSKNNCQKCTGVTVQENESLKKTYIPVNRYFGCERYEAEGQFSEATDGSRFYIYIVIDGSGCIKSGEATVEFSTGDTIFVPATPSEHIFDGCFTALKAYIPDCENIFDNNIKAVDCPY